MKRFVLLIIFICVTLEMSATYRYRLYLKDKPDSEIFSFSERAIKRREVQNIKDEETDKVVSPKYLKQLQDSGLVIITKSRWLNTVVVSSKDGKEIDAQNWKQFAFIDSVLCITSDNNEIRKPKRREVEDESTASTKTQNEENYMTPHYEMNADTLYDLGFKGKGMLIVVQDGGFLNADKYTSINANVIGALDMYNPTSNDILYQDGDGSHGTHCLSIMSSDGSLEVLGSAPEADYFLIRTENGPSETPLEEDMWIAGAEYADSIGADLISSSLGYFEYDGDSLSHKQTQLATGEVYITKGAETAASKGMIVCVAAGNERRNSWCALDFPADAKGVIAVGAMDKYLQPSSFTSPGFLTPYVKPDLSCRGTASYYLNARTGAPSTGNGTSYATPLLCGAIASLWSSAPSLSAKEMIDIVRQSGQNYANPDSLLGYGLPDFRIALKKVQSATSLIEEITEERPADHAIFDVYGRPLKEEPVQKIFISKGKLIYRKK